MLKSAVLCFLLWHAMCGCSGQATQSPTDNAFPNFPAIVLPKIDDTDLRSDAKVDYNVHVTQNIFYSLNNNTSENYFVTKGIGAHKVHVEDLYWYDAGRICASEGGHLAVIRSDEEERIVLELMMDSLVEEAWIGLHDQFQEGEWVSVLDEPIGRTGWLKKVRPDPSYASSYDCAVLVRNEAALVNYSCTSQKKFVCKI